MPRSSLTSTEYTQLYALKVERSNLLKNKFSDNEYVVIVNWLDNRISELESKKQ